MTRTWTVHALAVLSVFATGIALPDMSAGQAIRKGQLYRKLDVPQTDVLQAIYLDDGKTLVVCGSRELTFVDTKTLRWQRLPAGRFIALSQDRQRLVTDRQRLVTATPLRRGGRVTGPLTVWDLATRRPVRQVRWQPSWCRPGASAFLPDKRTLACSYAVPLPKDARIPRQKREYQQKIGFWNVDNGNLLDTWDGPLGPVTELAVSPDGKFLATCWRDSHGGLKKGGLLVWEMASGTIKHRLFDYKYHRSTIFLFGAPGTRSIKFSADGALLTAFISGGGREGGTKVWNVDTGVPVSTKSHLTTPFLSADGRRLPLGVLLRTAVFSPDGRYVITTRGTYPAILELESGNQVSKKLEVRQSHQQPIKAVACSPDGKVLATVAEDGIRFWNLAHDKFGMKPPGP